MAGGSWFQSVTSEPQASLGHTTPTLKKEVTSVLRKLRSQAPHGNEMAGLDRNWPCARTW